MALVSRPAPGVSVTWSGQARCCCLTPDLQKVALSPALWTQVYAMEKPGLSPSCWEARGSDGALGQHRGREK